MILSPNIHQRACALLRYLLMSCGLLCLLAGTAQAGLIQEVSRVIIQAPGYQSTVQVANSNSYPVVVQVWVDDGDIEAMPEESTAPIMPLPAIFRLDPGGQRNLRLMFSEDPANPLPKDRESLFWLNLYEIPPLPPGDDPYLLLTMRTQTKVFYRPEGLATNSYAALENVKFSLGQDKGAQVLLIRNDSPYHLTFSELTIESGKHSTELPADMVLPFSQERVPLPDTFVSSGSITLHYSLIDDLGSHRDYKRKL